MLSLLVPSCKSTLESNYCDWLEPISLRDQEILVLDKISKDQILLINRKYEECL